MLGTVSGHSSRVSVITQRLKFQVKEKLNQLLFSEVADKATTSGIHDHEVSEQISIIKVIYGLWLQPNWFKPCKSNICVRRTL